MLIIEYDPINGEIVPDGKVREWADDLVKEHEEWKEEDYVDDMVVVIGSVVMLDMTRALIVKKRLDHKEVTYSYYDLKQTPDKFGSLRQWPKGFCDTYDNILEELIGWDLM